MNHKSDHEHKQNVIRALLLLSPASLTGNVRDKNGDLLLEATNALTAEEVWDNATQEELLNS